MNQMVGSRRELADLVRAILLRDWDPIRVQEFPEHLRLANADEYDSYVEPLVGMMTEGRGKEALATYLLDIETRVMGQKAGNSRAALAATALFDLEGRLAGVG